MACIELKDHVIFKFGKKRIAKSNESLAKSWDSYNFVWQSCKNVFPNSSHPSSHNSTSQHKRVGKLMVGFFFYQ